MECDAVKAVISIGCCFNLLSEGGIKEADNPCGFPLSAGAKSASLHLGRNARDLACQVCSLLTCPVRGNMLDCSEQVLHGLVAIFREFQVLNAFRLIIYC